MAFVGTSLWSLELAKYTSWLEICMFCLFFLRGRGPETFFYVPGVSGRWMTGSSLANGR